jgi:hypothetical protein
LTASPPDSSIAYALGQSGAIPGIDSFWRERVAGSPPEFAAQATIECLKPARRRTRVFFAPGWAGKQELYEPVADPMDRS